MGTSNSAHIVALHCTARRRLSSFRQPRGRSQHSICLYTRSHWAAVTHSVRPSVTSTAHPLSKDGRLAWTAEGQQHQALYHHYHHAHDAFTTLLQQPRQSQGDGLCRPFERRRCCCCH